MSILSALIRQSATKSSRLLSCYTKCLARVHHGRGSIASIGVRCKTTESFDGRKPDYFSSLFDYEILSSSETEDEKNRKKETSLIDEIDILHEPQRERFGLTKAVVIIILGIYAGAYLAMIGAKVLEELEIFIDCDDED